MIAKLVEAISNARTLDEVKRVALFNAVSAALGELVADINPDPALSPRLIAADNIVSNEYNPNSVAGPEMALLESSMRADGITMAVVVIQSGDQCVIVDGFHRRSVAAGRLGRKYIPCAIIASSIGGRMASTVRHNRARGKHQVDLMASLVKEMMALGWDDEKISGSLGMTVEELLRLRQIAGAARMLASAEYTREWRVKK